MPSSHERILVYDGGCRLCVATKERLERLAPSGSVRFVPYESAEARARLGKHHRPGRPEVAFLIESDGTIRRGFDAFLPLLPAIPGGWLLERLMRVPLARPLARLLYRAIARSRYRLFGGLDCPEGCSIHGRRGRGG